MGKDTLEKITCILFAFLIATTVLFTNNAWPLGAGVSASVNAGQVVNYNSVDYDSAGRPRSRKIYDSYFLGTGIVLDTYAGEKMKYGYRFNAVFETITKNMHDGYNDDDSHYGRASRVHLIHTIPIDIYTDDYIQLWAGPHLGTGIYFGNYQTPRNTMLNQAIQTKLYFDYCGLYVPPSRASRDPYVDGSFFLGPVIGLNINTGAYCTISFDAGARLSFLFKIQNSKWIRDGIMRYEGFLNVSLIFRFGAKRKNAFTL